MNAYIVLSDPVSGQIKKRKGAWVAAQGARIHPTPTSLGRLGGQTKGWTHEFYTRFA